MISATSNHIDTSNLNFVGVEGQYMLAMAVLTDSSDKYLNFFSQNADLISYVDVVKPGFTLPTIEVIFTFSDRNLLSYLCEKSVFMVSIGRDIGSQIQSQFTIVTAQVNQKVQGKWAARVVGLYNKLDYMRTTKSRMFSGTSADVAQKILNETLGTKCKLNVSVRSKDQMLWHQFKESDYRFLTKMWLHSYTPDSLWMSAIDFEGVPRITDLRKQAKSVPNVILTTGIPTSKDTYSILDNFDVRNNSSLNNLFGGYDKSKAIYNMDENRQLDATSHDSVMLSESDTFNRDSSVATKAPYRIQTENVHKNYYSSPLQNRSMLTSLKSFQLDVTAEGTFLPVNILDYVILRDAQPNGHAQEDYSGIYMVGKVAHQIANNKIYTHSTLWRESMNTLAASSLADKAEVASSKLDALTDEVNSLSDMTSDAYENVMSKCASLKQKIEAYEEKVRDKATNTKAFKAYKELAKKYRTLQGYVSEIYGITSTLASLTPFADEVDSQLSKLTLDSPFDEVQNAVRNYLDLTKYFTEVEGKATEKFTSNSVYGNYQKLKSQYNRTTSTVQSLQYYGIIGDLNEYIES